MTQKKALLVPMTLAMHTKLKWAARQEGKSMSNVVRGLVRAYLAGEVEPGDGKLPPVPSARKNRARADNATWKVYDEVAAKVDRALQ